MSWLENQTHLLRVWISKTPHALLSSTADGGILYANEALEKLLGYTSHELASKDWKELTVNPDDLKSDVAMVESLLEGQRIEYEQQKSYRHKLGHPVDCFIHVHRYPEAGENVECFLVSVRPVAQAGQREIHKEVIAMRFAMLEQLEALVPMLEAVMAAKKTGFEQVTEWASKNKKAATMLSLFLLYILFGDRAFEVAERALTILRGP